MTPLTNTLSPVFIELHKLKPPDTMLYAVLAHKGATRHIVALHFNFNSQTLTRCLYVSCEVYTIKPSMGEERVSTIKPSMGGERVSTIKPSMVEERVSTAKLHMSL